jgi:putative flippase GtrA
MSVSSGEGIRGVLASRPRLSLFLQFLRFCLVGGLNTFVDVLVFNLIVWSFPTQDSGLLVVYNSVAYAIGALNSFCWNKLWTFRQRSSASGDQVTRFMLVTSLGIICNDAFLWLATNILTSLSLSSFIWINVAKISAIAGSVAVSYIGMRFSVFTKSEVDDMQYPPSNPPFVIVPGSLSVILPAYNEEALISATISDVMSVLSSWMRDFEVIVVNDGSKDKTGEIVADLAAYDRRIRLINHPVNKGYGAALVTGFESVTKEFAFFMDSDGQFDIRDLMRFFPLIEEYDAVLGYRIDRQDTWMRKLNAWGWKKLVGFIFGVHARDIDCAFKLFRAEFFRTNRLETRGAMINAEILYKLARAGYTFSEVGVQHLPRRAGKATGAKLSVILRALREMFIYAEKWRKEEQQTSFVHVNHTLEISARMPGISSISNITSIPSMQGKSEVAT